MASIDITRDKKLYELFNKIGINEERIETFRKLEKLSLKIQELVDKRNEFEKQHPYSTWIQKCFNDISQIINKNETDRLVNYKNPKKANNSM